jgi:hypothetical protein
VCSNGYTCLETRVTNYEMANALGMSAVGEARFCAARVSIVEVVGLGGTVSMADCPRLVFSLFDTVRLSLCIAYSVSYRISLAGISCCFV